MLDRPKEYERMAEAELQHWWYAALHRLVLDTLDRHGVDRNARILDSACGTGGLLCVLQQLGYMNASGFDLAPEALRVARQREVTARKGDLRDLPRLCEPESLDVLICNDALYFLKAKEQERFVEHCSEVLRPAGLLIMNLPALPAFRGIHDLSVGIGRRFVPGDVDRLFRRAPLAVLQMEFWPVLLSPLIYVRRLWQRCRMRHNPETPIRSDVQLPSPQINRLLTHITRFERRFVRWCPFGSSLFVVAQRVEQPMHLQHRARGVSTLRDAGN